MSKRRKEFRIQKVNVEKIWEVILMEGLGCWLTNTK
jgi:hypothetical protein